ncbi:hypothetical protein AAVH_26471, partial [Aphelenchoides avenae]
MGADLYYIHFSGSTLRPSSITFVDTPALFEPFFDAIWKNEIYDALRDCDIFYLVIRAFSDPSVEKWKSHTRDYGYQHERSSKSQHAQSSRIAFNIMTDRDMELVTSLLRNDTYRNDFDALETIVDNIRGFRIEEHSLGSVTTDERVRYHEWDARELEVLERLRLLTAKPVVYVINMDEEEFVNVSSTTTPVRASRDTFDYDDDYDDASGSVFLNARTYIEAHDRDALIVQFAGRLSQDEGKASSFDGGAHAIIERTIEDCKIGHFYTANKDLVAAWAFKLGLTVEEAIQLVNATLEPHVTMVEAVSMRAVVEAGSVEKARSLGMTRRLGFEDEVDDGDLLLLTPGVLGEGKE